MSSNFRSKTYLFYSKVDLIFQSFFFLLNYHSNLSCSSRTYFKEFLKNIIVKSIECPYSFVKYQTIKVRSFNFN